MRKISFSMRSFGAKTRKPTTLMANSALLSAFLTRVKPHSAETPKSKTTCKYIDGQGKKRWRGTSHLKGTQLLDSMC